MRFMVFFYQRLGFSGAEIGLRTGIPPLVTLLASPFWTHLADAKRWHKLVMGGGILVAVSVIVLLPSLSAFAPVFLTIILFNTFLAPVASLADSGTRSEERRVGK